MGQNSPCGSLRRTAALPPIAAEILQWDIDRVGPIADIVTLADPGAMLAACRPLPTVKYTDRNISVKFCSLRSTSPAPNTNEEYQCLAGLSPAVTHRARGQANVVFRQVGSWGS